MVAISLSEAVCDAVQRARRADRTPEVARQVSALLGGSTSPAAFSSLEFLDRFAFLC
jgi:hypothetical protein